LFFITALVRRKKGATHTQRSCEKGAKRKIQVASPHLLIFFFLFSIFKVHFVFALAPQLTQA
jgi:hypothetical protein